MRDRLQFQIQAALLARLTLLSDARGLLRAGSKVRVAQATPPTAGYHHAIARAHQVRGQPVLGTDVRAGRDGDEQILACLAMLTRTSAGTAAVGSEVPPAGELEQRRNARPGHQVDAAAAPTVSTVGAAEGDKLLTSERHNPVATVPSFYPDACFVDVYRHGRSKLVRWLFPACPQLTPRPARTPGNFTRPARRHNPLDCPNDDVLRLIVFY